MLTMTLKEMRLGNALPLRGIIGAGRKGPVRSQDPATEMKKTNPEPEASRIQGS